MQVDLIHLTTRDGVRLDGIWQTPTNAPVWPVHAVAMIHGTGGNFYASTLFDLLAERCLECGCGVLRINTRGHDGISNAITSKGGRRLGAAYEAVDDCRHDLAACVDWLKANVGPRVGLIGHSLGAVKCLYTVAHEPNLEVAAVIGISPPRLSYGWFCQSPDGPRFLEAYQRAEALVQSGQPMALMDVHIPLPMAITAAGYFEKYGPDERYNYLPLLHGLRTPTLITLGSVEVANNVAFRGAAEAMAELRPAPRGLHVATIAGADHFYTGARAELLTCVTDWFGELGKMNGSHRASER